MARVVNRELAVAGKLRVLVSDAVLQPGLELLIVGQVEGLSQLVERSRSIQLSPRRLLRTRRIETALQKRIERSECAQDGIDLPLHRDLLDGDIRIVRHHQVEKALKRQLELAIDDRVVQTCGRLQLNLRRCRPEMRLEIGWTRKEVLVLSRQRRA